MFHAAAVLLLRQEPPDMLLAMQDTDQPKILDYIRLKHDNMARGPTECIGMFACYGLMLDSLSPYP
jgi:hypothetical protein